ncbi:hypothetical protein NDU88_005219 [Pleurodeles waltl]|uniref:Uncharacterized protein n=1 Tax=Pleurodeles waltl TaxID=8319 RepID=A0AAV7M9D1_PLEWA|nr:hypothetical protein NDU88_005219 [Pleurodeles waltl]
MTLAYYYLFFPVYFPFQFPIGKVLCSSSLVSSNDRENKIKPNKSYTLALKVVAVLVYSFLSLSPSVLPKQGAAGEAGQWAEGGRAWEADRVAGFTLRSLALSAMPSILLNFALGDYRCTTTQYASHGTTNRLGAPGTHDTLTTLLCGPRVSACSMPSKVLRYTTLVRHECSEWDDRRPCCGLSASQWLIFSRNYLPRASGYKGKKAVIYFPKLSYTGMFRGGSKCLAYG